MRMPIAVTTKATTPMVELASAIFTSKKAKVNPTAKASILVAIDKVISRKPLVMSTFFPSSLERNDSQIILIPTANNRPKATQWSYCAIRLTIARPANHPINGIKA